MLGKIRRTYDAEVGKARGLLTRPLHRGVIEHSRKRPAAGLASWIAHYWSVSWDLPAGETYLAETLPDSSVHLTFEGRRCVIRGVHTRKFSRSLRGRSQVLGVKFAPGKFRPFMRDPVSALANRVVPARRIFGPAIEKLRRAVFAARNDNAKRTACDVFFRALLPAADPTADIAAKLVRQILHNPGIRTVNDLAVRSGISKRSLQRIFREYVGISPKWVIRRYRLHEVVQRIHGGESPDWAQLALDLGYFDQAHLINDFRSTVGFAPRAYAKLISRGL
ncbi:MAG TPA: AraC family transcriptional regulator [Candidatus Acidoferrum sp.]